MTKHIVVRICISLLVLLACCKRNTPAQKDAQLQTASWEDILREARGTTVYWMHWRGDPAINEYVDEFVTKRMAELYGVTVVPIDGQGSQIYSKLLLDQQAGTAANGKIDLVWINGETFHQLRESDLLYGPFAQKLPNYRYVDTDNPIIKYDFEQPTDGYESPWGCVQFALIYNSEKVPDPPRTIPALKQWIIAHPGKFTYDASFTGVTFMKTLLYGLSGGVAQFQGKYDSALYAQKIQLVWNFLNDIKPYLWKQGKTYPENVAKLHSLFANQEVYFTMSDNDGEVDNKIAQGVLPGFAKAYIPEEGTIANTHYQGIPFNAANKAGAMVLCNFLLSPEAQYEKLKPAVWADGTVLNVSALPQEWQEKFRHVPGRVAAPPREELKQYARPEIRPEYHEKILEDWRKNVLEAK
jgi:putative spermidine/putrescine transport system substrate-binding protein